LASYQSNYTICGCKLDPPTTKLCIEKPIALALWSNYILHGKFLYNTLQSNDTGQLSVYYFI